MKYFNNQPSISVGFGRVDFLPVLSQRQLDARRPLMCRISFGNNLNVSKNYLLDELLDLIFLVIIDNLSGKTEAFKKEVNVFVLAARVGLAIDANANLTRL